MLFDELQAALARHSYVPAALFFHHRHLGDLLDRLGFRVGGFRAEG